MDVICPSCRRPNALSYAAWIADKNDDDEHISCFAHLAYSDGDFWGDESIPDCRVATINHLRAELAAATASDASHLLDVERHEHEVTKGYRQHAEQERDDLRAELAAAHACIEAAEHCVAIVRADFAVWKKLDHNDGDDLLRLQTYDAARAEYERVRATGEVVSDE